MEFKTLLITFFLGTFLGLNAQTYELTITNEDFEKLQGGISLNGEMTWDDPDYTIPIGFDFEFFDEVTNEISITENGLGGTLIPGSGFTDVVPALAAYGADIIDRGYNFVIDEPTPESESNISYLTKGNPGSFIFVIEWNNVGFYSEYEEDGISSDFTSFQLWLYQGSNDIEIRFGLNSINNPESSFDGESGTAISLFESIDINTEIVTGEAYSLAGMPELASLSPVVDFDEDFTYLNGVIPSGTVYRFSKNITATSDELAQQLLFSAFPNPVSNNLEIQLGNTEHQINKVTIRNLTGQTLKEIAFDNQSSIDFSELTAGVYLLEVNTSAGVINQKILKK